MLDLEYITLAYLKYYRRKFTYPWELNYGSCYRWAYLTYQLHGGQLITITHYIKAGWEEDYDEYLQDASHAFLKINNKYYDSEAVQGVEDWKQLGFVKRTEENKVNWDTSGYYKIKEHKSALSFRRFWKFRKQSDRADKKLFQRLRQMLDAQAKHGYVEATP